MYAHLCRRHPAAHDGSNIAHREVLYITQRHGNALRLVELMESLRDDSGHVGGNCDVGRSWLTRGLLGKQRRIGGPISPPAQQGDGIPIGNLQQPWPHAFALSKLIDPGQRLQERCLDDIFGIGTIPQQSLRHVEDGVDVRIEEIFQP